MNSFIKIAAILAVIVVSSGNLPWVLYEVR
jgi:hypothetical protein